MELTLIGIGNVTERYRIAFASLPGVSVRLVHRTDDASIRCADAIAILTEPQSHYELALRYREIPMMIEKPVALSLEHVREIAAACRHVTPCFQLRYDSAFQTWFAREGAGVRQIEAVLNLPRDTSYFTDRPWRGELAPVLHHGIHAVDLFIYWFGPGEVTRRSMDEIEMVHKDGVHSRVRVNLAASKKHVAFRVNGAPEPVLEGLGRPDGLCAHFAAHHTEEQPLDIAAMAGLSALLAQFPEIPKNEGKMQ